MPQPQIPSKLNEAGAVDLSKVRERADAEKAAQEARAMAAAEVIAYRWDRAMTRAFKGILSAPARRRMLLVAADRQDES